MPQIEPILAKYGFPTAIAAGLMYFVDRMISMLSDQIEFIARLVDSTCGK